MIGHRPKHLILVRGRRSMASALDRKIRRCNASETISSLPFLKNPAAVVSENAAGAPKLGTGTTNALRPYTLASPWLAVG
jgi:hypothetical protein